MLVTTKITCQFCLTVASLPDTLPFSHHVDCPACGQNLKRYMPCVACELAFNPDLPACPQCGARPPEDAMDRKVYAVPDRVIRQAIARARELVRAAAQQTAASTPNGTAMPETKPSIRGQEPTRAAQADTPLEPAKPVRAASNGANGRSNGAAKRAAALADLPELTVDPIDLNDENGDTPAAQSAPSVHTVTADDAGALFDVEVDGPDVAISAQAINAEFELITEQARLAEVVAELSGEPVIAVDTETTGLDPFAENALLLVQVATPRRAYLVDVRRVDPRPLRRILEDDRVLKLLQNAKFDYKMLRYQVGIGMRRMYDTMLAERVLTAGISREIGLASLARKYAGVTLDKSVRTSFIDKTGEFSHEQLRYAARDALILFTIYTQQREALKREKMLEVALLEFKTVVAVGEMELAGCLIDKARWRTIIDSAQAERDRAADELGMLVSDYVAQQSLFGGPAINLNSNAQLLETFGRMGIVMPDTMEATLQKYDHPAIKKLLEYRGFEKMLSAFGEKFLELIHPRTGRIHPDFNQLGADTGRFSCTNPNVQQIPATSDFRACFVAPPGYKLITCDYSQAELRILAQLSEDPAFVDAFQSGGDLHQLTASQMFRVAPDLVDKKQRGAAKVINFGLAYGRGPAALGVQLGVSTDEAKALIEQYFKAYSGIQRWLDKAAREAVRKGYSITMLGRRRYYAPIDSNDPEYNKKRASIERQGKNSPIQGCLAGNARIHERTRGYVPIAGLVGEQVSVWDGHQFADAVVMPSGMKQLVRVTLWGGHYIECSPDHRFLIRDPNGRYMWKTPGEFKPQYRVMLTEGVPAWSCATSLPAATCGGSWNGREVSPSKIENPAGRGEWPGRLASDGSLASGAASLLVAEHEEMPQPRLQASCADLGHVGHWIRITTHQPRRFHKLTVPSRGLVGQLRASGVKERIPDNAWHDGQVLTGYLRGMFDGDGTVAPGGAILVFGQALAHLDWAREVQQALLLFGIRSRIRSYLGDRTVVQVLKKDMPIFAERVGFMNPLKQAKAVSIAGSVREKTYGRGVRVRHVELTDTWVEMYDVVNSTTGRFMANGLIVHNSNADMTKLALVGLHEALQGYDARVVNTVHDEIVVEARDEQAEAVCKIVEHEMVKAGAKIITLVPVVAEAKIADYWSK